MKFDDVLEALDVDLEPFALCEIRGEASLGLGRKSHPVLHYFLTGDGVVTIDGRPPIPVGAGSVVLIPAFVAHSLHALGTGSGTLPNCRPLDLAIDHLHAGSGDGVVAAICGRVTVAVRGLGGTMDLLREPIVEHLGKSDRIRIALDDLVSELASPTIGTRALGRSLLLQCVILLFRRRLQAGETSLAWLPGLHDETLWDVLRCLLDRPGDSHTVESLAERAGMSRAAFAGRFSAAYGTGPIDLLRTIRLRRAAELLARSDLPVKRIAHLVGYESRTYFSRAFKQEHRVSPDAFRRSLVAPSRVPH
jgi:AraC-like DNA-binding protein